MLTGEVRHQIDRIWDAFWSGGISNIYEEPFTGIHYEGLDGVFPSTVADEIVTIIELINANAKVSTAA